MPPEIKSAATKPAKSKFQAVVIERRLFALSREAPSAAKERFQLEPSKISDAAPESADLLI
jgi:hypothetical protein